MKLWVLSKIFGRLGCIAFGGPAAHVAMVEDEIVERRGWMDRQHFLDLLGATSLIPGPNSTELVLHIGFERARWPGLLVAGLSFILPAAGITALLAALYLRYGSVPTAATPLAGIHAAVPALILAALWKLGRKAVKGPRTGVLGVAAAGATLGGLAEIWALLGAGILGAAWLAFARRGGTAALAAAPMAVAPLATEPLALPTTLQATVLEAGAQPDLWRLGWFFAKVGAVLYGSGYVLIAFLEGGLVDDLGWLTQQQLLDAIAVGQLTPGPVLTTATFIGWVLAGPLGAVMATVAIFLPSFLLVPLVNPWVPRLRASVVASAFLDSVNAAAVGLMAAVTLQLALDAVASWPTATIFAAASAAALRFRASGAWVVGGGALAGWLLL